MGHCNRMHHLLLYLLALEFRNDIHQKKDESTKTITHCNRQEKLRLHMRTGAKKENLKGEGGPHISYLIQRGTPTDANKSADMPSKDFKDHKKDTLCRQ